jgi:hypothetical protein
LVKNTIVVNLRELYWQETVAPSGNFQSFLPIFFYFFKSGFAFRAAFDVSNLAVSREKQFKYRQTIIYCQTGKSHR